MQVAVWSISSRGPVAQLCDTEDKAAGLALGVRESGLVYGQRFLLGVQFENGRLIPVENFGDWKVYQDLVKSREELVPQSVEPQRTARSPFLDWTGARAMTSVPESYPEWVGAL